MIKYTHKYSTYRIPTKIKIKILHASIEEKER